MMKKIKVNNVSVFIFFALIICLIIGIFAVFIMRFQKLDDTKYPIEIGSVFYNDDFNYLKVENESYLAQRFDGNYYWYRKEDNKTIKENVGANPVVYNKSDYKVNLFGSVYQVMSTGEVKSLNGLTEISKTSPTKFYKLKDRKYLMVDSKLRSDNKVVNTSGYLIIELDKQGNATFANNEINIKTVKPLILKGTTMNFDIANEKLIYGKKTINLKNIIGSTNTYKEDPNKKTKEEEENGKENSGETVDLSSDTYYDEYMKDVIYSVNNLTKSVTDVNEKTDTSVKKGEIYFDFSKYIALKNVSSSVSTITVNYAVVDSNNEYQNVFLHIDDDRGFTNRYYLNKNETSYTIRDLAVDTNYTLSFGYKLVTDDEEVIEDIVNVKTKSPSCSITVSKVSRVDLTYHVKIGSEYKFDAGTIHLYIDGISSSQQEVDMNKAASTGGFTGTFQFSNLGVLNTLKLENLVYNGNNVTIDCSYRFSG